MPRVHRAALGLLADEQEAREIAQEALVKAYAARERYDSRRPFYPWLYRIVRNLALDARRRARHRAVSGLDTERVVSSGRDPESSVAQAQSADRLRAAMAALSEDHAEILSMRHFQDLSYAEIGEILEIPKGTVMSRLYRARNALAAELGGDE